jgi:hypothetical protein
MFYPTPQQVVGLTSGIKAFYPGPNSNCVVMQSGEAKCWGGNGNGQLGLGHTSTVNTPTTVTAVGSGVSFIALSDVRTARISFTTIAHCLRITAVAHCAS